MELTAQWEGERFEDGRPKVSDGDLEEIRQMTLEEMWLPLYVRGYKFQFEGEMKVMHPGKKLVGRAVTCTFIPTRPDLYKTVYAEGESRGWVGMCNQWVVDNLVENDILVADMFDKVENGTFIGGNLTTAIATHTKKGGAVIWGGVRDTEQMDKIGVQVYYRGTDPTPIRECLMTGYNAPSRIGGAVCLPGDVVLGTNSGVLFIPSHLVKELIEHAHKSHAKDVFGFEMIEKGVYTTAQVDYAIWTEEMMEALQNYLAEKDEMPRFKKLDWSLEVAAAKGEEAAVAEMMKYHLE
ncbi:MAG: RraA family protein [Oscillospiraceae bacterium]